jgi:hypothetical protein
MIHRTLDQTNAIGLIGCLINWSNTLGSIRYSIDLMILSWSIGRVLIRINHTLDRTFTVSSLRKSSHFKSYQWTSYLIEKAFTCTHTHTHALHELSNLFKISIRRKICAYWILNSHLYLCICLQCYLTALSVDHICVFWS